MPSSLKAVAVMTPFMYVGFDVIPQAAEEINIPFQMIGRIIILSILMAVGWYVLIIFSVSMSLDAAAVSASKLVTADAMKAAFGGSRPASDILIIAGIGGIITSWNSFFVGGSRAVYAMAESVMLPPPWQNFILNTTHLFTLLFSSVCCPLWPRCSEGRCWSGWWMQAE